MSGVKEFRSPAESGRRLQDIQKSGKFHTAGVGDEGVRLLGARVSFNMDGFLRLPSVRPCLEGDMEDG